MARVGPALLLGAACSTPSSSPGRDVPDALLGHWTIEIPDRDDSTGRLGLHRRGGQLVGHLWSTASDDRGTLVRATSDRGLVRIAFEVDERFPVRTIELRRRDGTWRGIGVGPTGRAFAIGLRDRERPQPLPGGYRRPIRPPALVSSVPAWPGVEEPPAADVRLSDDGDVIWTLEPVDGGWAWTSRQTSADDARRQGLVARRPAWWAPEPDRGGVVYATRGGRVKRLGPAPVAIADLDGEVRRVSPEWPARRLIVTVRPPEGGVRVVAVALDDGATTALAEHPSADDLLLDLRDRVRAVVFRERLHGHRGVHRDQIRIEGPDGRRWGEVWQPTWVEDRDGWPLRGDGPVYLLAGPELAAPTTVGPAGLVRTPVPGAWGDAVARITGPSGVEAVAWHAERLHWHAESAVSDDFAWLERSLDGDFDVVQRAAADRRWVVRTWSGDEAVSHWIFDRDARSLVRVGRAPRPSEGRTEARVVAAPDGRKLAVYVTTPRRGKGPHPLVVEVHGGPWAGRHQLVPDPLVEAWSARGYMTLRVNFRGTYGFGWSNTYGPDARYGGAMIDDLAHVLDQLVGEGHVDEERIAMVGASYGGYAALRFATAERQRLRCAVAGLPRGNLTVPGGPLDVESVGSLAWREAHSPDRHIDRLTAPVLVWNGGLDGENADARIVDFVQRAAARGKDVAWVRFPFEHHGLEHAPNGDALLAVGDRFLGACLGGPAWAWPEDFAEAELEVRLGAQHVPGLLDATEPIGR